MLPYKEELMPNLSDAALSLLRRRLAGERVEVTEESHPFYRELAAAGLMEPLHSFSRGKEGHFRFTEAGVRMRDVLNVSSSRVPSA
jgi:hypothetical protein